MFRGRRRRHHGEPVRDHPRDGHGEHRAVVHPRDVEQHIDELLEVIWMMREEGVDEPAALWRRSGLPEDRHLLEQMVADKLIQVAGHALIFAPAGEERAQGIIRRHRLAERLMTDLFELEEEHAEPAACQFEHILSPEVTDSVCTLLGHPPTCPHGKRIPRGECCAKFRRDLKPLVTSLSELEIGREARIVFITPKSHARLDRLSTLGVAPGRIIKLQQKHPAYVVQVGQTVLALDKEITDEIYVK